MYTVVSAEKNIDEGKIIRHEVYSEFGDNREIEYSAVIGGLSWPSEYSSGYYLIMGQSRYDEDYRSFVNKKPVLKFLMEFESQNLRDLVTRLSDDANMLLCDTFYCDMAGIFEGFAESFYEYSTVVGGFNLVQAPFTNNFHFGSQKVGERIKDKSMEIPELAVVREQIDRMEVKDLQNKPESYFGAVNALRYLVCGVEKYSPGPIPPAIMARIIKSRGPRPGGFMAS